MVGEVGPFVGKGIGKWGTSFRGTRVKNSISDISSLMPVKSSSGNKKVSTQPQWKGSTEGHELDIKTSSQVSSAMVPDSVTHYLADGKPSAASVSLATHVCTQSRAPSPTVALPFSLLIEAASRNLWVSEGLWEEGSSLLPSPVFQACVMSPV